MLRDPWLSPQKVMLTAQMQDFLTTNVGTDTATFTRKVAKQYPSKMVTNKIGYVSIFGIYVFLFSRGDIVHHSAYTNLTSLPTRGVRYPVTIHIYIHISCYDYNRYTVEMGPVELSCNDFKQVSLILS